MRCNAVKNRSHLDLNIFLGNIRVEDIGAVGLGKYSLAHILPYLSSIYVKGSDNINVTSSIAVDIIMHQPNTTFFTNMFIIFNSLN